MGPRILVIDDEFLIRQLLQRFLIQKGFDVDTASNGQEALEKMRRDHPVLAVMDIRMPVMDGLEVLQALRQSNDKTIIMVLTAYDDMRERVMQLGSCDYMTKPFHLEDLEKRIMHHLHIDPLKKAS